MKKMSGWNGTTRGDARRQRRKWRREESGNIVRESLFPSSFGKNG